MKGNDGWYAILEDGAGVQKSSVSSHANDQVDLVCQIHGRTEHADLVLDRLEGRIVAEILLWKGGDQEATC